MATYPHRSAPARATVQTLLAQLRRILPARNTKDWHRRFFARDAIRHLCRLIRIQKRRVIAAEMALFEASSVLTALRTGQAPFDAMTADERQEQLAMLLDDSPDAITRAEIERPEDFAHIDLSEFVRIRPEATE